MSECVGEIKERNELEMKLINREKSSNGKVEGEAGKEGETETDRDRRERGRESDREGERFCGPGIGTN